LQVSILIPCKKKRYSQNIKKYDKILGKKEKDMRAIETPLYEHVLWEATMSKPKGKGSFILVKCCGLFLDEMVLSLHATNELAERAMRKLGGEPRSMFQGSMRIVSANDYDVIEIFGKWIIRPKTRV